MFNNIRYLFNTILSLISIFLIAIIIISITPIVYFYTILFDRKKLLYLHLTKLFSRLFFYFSFINPYSHIDFNNIKKPELGKKRIYVLSHASIIDGLLLFFMPGHVKFMANEKYAKIPIFGLGIHATDNISVSRENQGANLDMYYHAAEILDKGYPLVIFPEGTRTRNGKIGRFQNSAFMLALEKQAEIVPVVIDTWNFIRPNEILVRNRNFKVAFLDKIPYESYKHLTYKELSKIVKFRMIEKLITLRENKEQNDEMLKELDELLLTTKLI